MPVHRHEPEVHAVERGLLGLLLGKGAHHAHAGQVLPDPFGQVGIERLDGFKPVVNLPAKKGDRHGDQRQRRQGQHRQPGIEIQHHADGRHAGGHRVGRVHDAGAQHVAHGVQVVGELRHQIAGTILGVVPRRETQQMSEEIVAQVVLDVARNPDQDPAHPELKERLGQGNEDEQGREEEHGSADAPGRETVNSLFQDERQAGTQGLGHSQSTKPYQVKTGAKCPECGKELVQRISKAKRRFYGCSGYPDCKFATFTQPLPKACPDCGGLMVAQRNKTAKCLKCSHTEKLEDEKTAVSPTT